MHSPQELVSQLGNLTSLPSVYVRVREIIEAPDSSLASIAGAVSADPALCARILKLVNSPAFGQSARVDSIGRAISLLGLDRVHDLVLAMSLSSTFHGMQPRHMDMQRFWRGSVMRGLAARQATCQFVAHDDPERMFLTGLLSDLGHLTMYQVVPELAESALLTAEENNEPLPQVEQRVVGCDDAEVGAALLAYWRLPCCFTDAVGAQHQPLLAGQHQVQAAVVQLAAHLAMAEQHNLDDDTTLAQTPETVWEHLPRDDADLAALRKQIRSDLRDYLSALFPDT